MIEEEKNMLRVIVCRPDEYAEAAWIGTAFTLPILLVFIGFGIVPSAMAYIVYYRGISKITETSRIPVLASVETVVAAIIGLVVFGQSLSFTKIIGIALVLASIAVMNWKSAN